jgi:hypothetical protein
VDVYAFSPDKKRIAFTKEYAPNGGNNDVNIRNLENDSSDIVIKSEFGINRGIFWSPTGVYLLVDAGTGPEGSLTAYDSSSGNELSSFGDGNFDWLDEKTIIMTQRTNVSPYRPWGGGEGYSLARIDILTGESEILMDADDKNDYSFINLGDTCFYYVHDRVNNTDDWGYFDKTSTSYYCLDLKEGTNRPITESEAVTDDTLLRREVEKIFPEYAIVNRSEILSINVHPSYKNWIIIGIYHGESIYSLDMLVFDQLNPRETIRKLGTGGAISWF